jgi:hypothetical protein
VDCADVLALCCISARPEGCGTGVSCAIATLAAASRTALDVLKTAFKTRVDFILMLLA